MTHNAIRLALVLLLPSVLLAAPADEWRTWRGPNGNGTAASGQSPVSSWSKDDNILWEAKVPGRGHSTPIVVGKLVVLTTADKGAETQSVVAYDRDTGKRLWIREIHRGNLAEEIHSKNTHASPSVASDGKRIYATFCNDAAISLTALDMSGKIVWSKRTGAFDPKLYRFGYAPSPTLYGDSVIVVSDFENGYIASFATKDGKENWRTPRQSKHVSYSSPIVAKVAKRDQLLISGRAMVASYDPKNGKMIWSASATTNATCGTMIWNDDLVFASGGYPKKETVAIRADGSKEIVWKNRRKSYEQSMLIHKGFVYAFTDDGIVYCWNATTGEERWHQRLRGPVSASPILADGKIYASNERGRTYVFEANPEKFVSVAENELGDESFASPTIVDGKIFLRHASRASGSRQETLYCIGKK